MRNLDDGLALLAKRVRKLEVLPRGGGGGPGPGGDRHIIQDEGIDLPDQPRLNFIGDGVTATDNPATNTTDVTIPGGGTGTGCNPHLIWLKKTDSTTEYARTSAGLDLASAAAVAGDIITIPLGYIDGNHTLKAGVHYVGRSREGSYLTGIITLSENTRVENLSIEVDGITHCLIPPASGEVILYNCDCIVTNSGDAYPLYYTGASNIKFKDCKVWGESSAGNGYAARVVSTYGEEGEIFFDDTTVYGSTERFLVEVS
jgi:hypothetical protein